MEEVVSWYDAATCGRDGHPPKLAQNDPLVLKLLGAAGQRQYGALHSLLPVELRVFSLEKAALSDVEKKQLYLIKQHKRPRLEKPVRRGGVVISAAAAAGRPSTSGSTRKPKVSAFVDIAAVEGGGDDGTKNEAKRSRVEGAGDDGSDRGGDADDGENSVSSMGDNADDDDAVDDLSGGGSGDELTF
jgi:hypothetical protein